MIQLDHAWLSRRNMPANYKDTWKSIFTAALFMTAKFRPSLDAHQQKNKFKRCGFGEFGYTFGVWLHREQE